MTNPRFAACVVASVFGFLSAGWTQAGSPPQSSPATPNGSGSNQGITIHIGNPDGRTSGAVQAPGNPSDENSILTMADGLLASGRAADAQTKYQQVTNVHPDSIRAQVGLIRSLIMQLKLQEAQSTADTALALHPQSAELITALGDLQFAQGKIPDAERSFLKARELKPSDAAPYLGLARIYRAYSLYGRAYENMKRAHELAPDDVAVQLLWFNSLPQQDRIPSVQAYMATAKLSPQTSNALQNYMAFLKHNADAPVHPCKLVSNVRETETKLLALPRPGTALGASGLVVKINNQEMHLALDTGASGVILGRTSAEKLGLQRLGYQPIVGMGDSEKAGGYGAVANRIRVGDLEFEDCMIKVTDAATPVTGQDGLIGTDVFSAYQIDIDIPGAKLRLSPLPKRPDEATEPTALKTLARDSQEFETEAPANAAAGKPASENFPRDAYVAPEMANWTKVYRFRSLLLVPTKVDNTGPVLFLIDTGSFGNVLSTQAARELTQVRADPSMKVRGLSGNVSQVYRADKATLQFGRYEQQNQDVVTFDLTKISRLTGTQVSGILGFNMLRILQIKLDYRDGLVDFVYDPNRLPKQIKLNNPAQSASQE